MTSMMDALTADSDRMVKRIAELEATLRRLSEQIDCSDTFNRPTLRANDACWSEAGCQAWFVQNNILRDIIRSTHVETK